MRMVNCASIEQRLVRVDPAQAMLDTVGSNPANVIVVGNLGLSAAEGQLLGSVPRDVVKNAICDVLIVQTSALDEERVLGDRSAGTPRAAGAVSDQAADHELGNPPLNARTSACPDPVHLRHADFPGSWSEPGRDLARVGEPAAQ